MKTPIENFDVFMKGIKQTELTDGMKKTTSCNRRDECYLDTTIYTSRSEQRQ